MVAIANLTDEVKIIELMGDSKDLDVKLSPSEYAILVGTQDILMSRALNRGYASSPFRWPMDFALLNNDAYWIFDEVQLLGDALATSSQLAGFRKKFSAFGMCPCVWMSATFDHSWLKTVDFLHEEPAVISLTAVDLANAEINRRLTAAKAIQRAEECESTKGCAEFVRDKHKPGTLTLIVANTVRRAQEIWEHLQKLGLTESRLLHSRFRPADRIKSTEEILSLKDAIVVATQVIEAGVDLDAELMITDIAPWPSLVQRFGRVNRRGDKMSSNIFWVSKPIHGTKALTNEAMAKPYKEEQIAESRNILQSLTSASPLELPKAKGKPPYDFVLRKSDLLDLFDTTPDLAGNHIDVSRFVRTGEETNIYIVWRDWDNNVSTRPPSDLPRVQKRELCPVAISEDLKKFLSEKETWYWDFTNDGSWRKVVADQIYPGMQIVCHTSTGGYNTNLGWSPTSKIPVPSVEGGGEKQISESATDHNERSFGPKQTLAEHTDEVVTELNSLLAVVSPLIGEHYTETLRTAARYHDWGKAHPAFQKTMHGKEEGFDPILAKSDTSRKHSVRWFRHELASALAMISRDMHPLTVYIVAAHHGKVRVNLRSMPGERPDGGKAVVRGIKQGDKLLAAALGGGTNEKPAELDLAITELGLNDNGNPSWTDRIFEILQRIGPFRLSYLEMLLRSADQRASERAEAKQ